MGSAVGILLGRVQPGSFDSNSVLITPNRWLWLCFVVIRVNYGICDPSGGHIDIWRTPPRVPQTPRTSAFVFTSGLSTSPQVPSPPQARSSIIPGESFLIISSEGVVISFFSFPTRSALLSFRLPRVPSTRAKPRLWTVERYPTNYVVAGHRRPHLTYHLWCCSV